MADSSSQTKSFKQYTLDNATEVTSPSLMTYVTGADTEGNPQKIRSNKLAAAENTVPKIVESKTDAAYVYAQLADGSPVKIANADLASLIAQQINTNEIAISKANSAYALTSTSSNDSAAYTSRSTFGNADAVCHIQRILGLSEVVDGKVVGAKLRKKESTKSGSSAVVASIHGARTMDGELVVLYSSGSTKDSIEQENGKWLWIERTQLNADKTEVTVRTTPIKHEIEFTADIPVYAGGKELCRWEGATGTIEAVYEGGQWGVIESAKRAIADGGILSVNEADKKFLNIEEEMQSNFSFNANGEYCQTFMEEEDV